MFTLITIELHDFNIFNNKLISVTDIALIEVFVYIEVKMLIDPIFFPLLHKYIY